MKDRLCTCVSDPEITCQIHPTLRSLEGYISELISYIEAEVATNPVWEGFEWSGPV